MTGRLALPERTKRIQCQKLRNAADGAKDSYRLLMLALNGLRYCSCSELVLLGVSPGLRIIPLHSRSNIHTNGKAAAAVSP